MTDIYTLIPDIQGKLPDIPQDSIVSRTLFSDDSLKLVLFGFAPGQELSEHTAALPAILHFLEGEARLVLGEEEIEAKSGTWVHMPPHLPHSVQAKTLTVMLLILLNNQERA